MPITFQPLGFIILVTIQIVHMRFAWPIQKQWTFTFIGFTHFLAVRQSFSFYLTTRADSQITPWACSARTARKTQSFVKGFSGLTYYLTITTQLPGKQGLIIEQNILL